MREDERVGNDATLAGSDGDDDEEEEGKDWLSSGEQLYNPKPKVMIRLGNRRVKFSVFGSKSCVFLAVCGQIWPKILGTYDLRSS